MLNEKPVTDLEVYRDPIQVAGFLDYLRWLATAAAEGSTVTAAQLWAFYTEHIRRGRYPTAVAEDLGLPCFPLW